MNLKKIEKIASVLLAILFAYFFSMIIYEGQNIDYSYIQEETEKREPFRHETKDVEVFVENVFRKKYSNVFKETQYYIESDGKNGYSRFYITEDLYLKLKETLKEPSLVKFSCNVMNGYLEGTDYHDYVTEIYDLVE